MAHTYVLNHLHVVFSTKDRLSLISPAWEHELHAYFGGIARNKGFFLDCSGGTADHVHLLLNLPGSCELATAVSALKANSSRWAKDRSPHFSWQQGYAAFSVSYSVLPAVRAYVSRQKAHHAKLSFNDELRIVLHKHNIPYDSADLIG